MTSRRRWVRRAANKIPLTGAGRYASSTKPSTWASFEQVSQSTAGVGLGFVLGDGIGCWDFDHCITDGKLAGWALEAIAAIAEPVIFAEVSQSGEGVHVFVQAREGPGRVIRDGERCIEFYSTGRYIAVTGNKLTI
jgi:primase-polymerase (primpol)-like protein